MGSAAQDTLALYCYDGDQDGLRGPSNAVVLHLSVEDYQLHFNADEKLHVGTHAIGRYVEVTDQATGKRYNVASAPCGSGCHCAAIAERV